MTTFETTLYPKIPLDAGRTEGWKDIPIREGAHPDPLIPLGALSREAEVLMTSSVYFGEHSNSPYADKTKMIDGSLLTLFARRSTAHRLLAAERLLPYGHHLLIFDAYRPYGVQKSLHDFYKQKLGEKHPDMSSTMLESTTQKYVSLPSTNPALPSPHSTGGVIDLAIVKLDPVHQQDWQEIRFRLMDVNLSSAERMGLEIRLSAIMRRHSQMLDFGTAFDHGAQKSALTYYESKLAAGETLTDREMIACNNRRLLFNVMTQVGFEPYFAEWWHFNAPESQMGAATAGRDVATFGAAELDEANKAYETARCKIRREVLILQGTGKTSGVQVSVHAEILAALIETGDPRQVEGWPVEIIAPPTK